MTYTHRVLENKLTEFLSFFSVVGLTGPRQSGKSTLLLHVLPEYQYITFDDHRAVEAFYADPEKFLRLNQNKVIFDEAQKVPEIFNAIKILVDQDRNQPGKFILTGSSQFILNKNISESLAGRIGLLTLLPYQLSEVPKALRPTSIYLGGYPELVNKKYHLFDAWFSSYLDTYLNKDIRSLANIGDLRDFNRFLRLLAADATQILNMSRYASDIGVDIKTIKRWISILEASYIIYLLPPYHKNFGKRINKRPKVYFYDTGLISYLTGITTLDLFENGPMTGALFENYVVIEIIKKECHGLNHAGFYYYRTNHGVEIDLIIDRQSHQEFLEIKSGETFKTKMIEPIEQFISPEDKGWLLYRGQKLKFNSSIQVVNYQDYLLPGL